MASEDYQKMMHVSHATSLQSVYISNLSHCTKPINPKIEIFAEPAFSLKRFAEKCVNFATKVHKSMTVFKALQTVQPWYVLGISFAEN